MGLLYSGKVPIPPASLEAAAATSGVARIIVVDVIVAGSRVKRRATCCKTFGSMTSHVSWTLGIIFLLQIVY